MSHFIKSQLVVPLTKQIGQKLGGSTNPVTQKIGNLIEDQKTL